MGERMSIRRILMFVALISLFVVGCQQQPAADAPADSSASEGQEAGEPPAEEEAPAEDEAAAEEEAPAEEEASSEEVPSEVTLTDGKVVVGVLNDASGVYADLAGPNGVEAVEMAVEDFKAKYGEDVFGGEIEVISADHQSKPDLANSKAQEMFDRDKADAIVDLPTSSAALAVSKVAAEKKKLALVITGGTTALTNSECNRYTFHYAYDTFMLAHSTGSWVTENIGKNWYIIYPDYAFGQDMEATFRKSIESAGGTVALSDATPFPNDDFSSYLLKAPSISPAPKVLGAMQAGNDLVNVVKQYNEFGLKDQGITLATGLLFLTDIHALGPDQYAGNIFTTAWYWNMDEQSRAWADRFLERTGTRPTFAHAGDYSATWQYLEAIRRAGTDETEAIIEELEGYEFSDMFARNAYVRPEDHRVIHDAYLAKVKSKAEVEEEWDYVEVMDTIPAEDAFMPLADSTCEMN